MPSQLLRYALAAIFIVSCGCSKVYVPADGYSCTITISVPAEATAGEWISLKASRTNGPWKAKTVVISTSPGEFPKQPPNFEDDVQANLWWLTDPPGALRLEVPTLESIRRDPKGRKAIFDHPGVYRVWAVTAYPTHATSIVQTITIKPKL